MWPQRLILPVRRTIETVCTEADTGKSERGESESDMEENVKTAENSHCCHRRALRQTSGIIII